MEDVAKESECRDPADIWERKRPATEYFGEVLVHFGPIRKNAKDKEEYCKTCFYPSSVREAEMVQLM